MNPSFNLSAAPSSIEWSGGQTVFEKYTRQFPGEKWDSLEQVISRPAAVGNWNSPGTYEQQVHTLQQMTYEQVKRNCLERHFHFYTAEIYATPSKLPAFNLHSSPGAVFTTYLKHTGQLPKEEVKVPEWSDEEIRLTLSLEDNSGNVYYVNSVDAYNLTEEWVIERIVHLLDGLHAEAARCLAKEWGLDWPDISGQPD